ncbi:tetratricopeptide repeat protein [Pseudoxanthomonas sp. CF125]|uniref:tetratricopeptide repeat protein n=1 Tax=Pseudoxanthomonas sp. CF125 TaxID=1855303 RepID=UPI00115FEB4B|nr:tetratricopeptide repeat protein [Pseudoxanthomonas sp. CF125]
MRHFLWLAMAGFTAAIIPRVVAAAEGAPAGAPASSEARLQRAESLLDAWEGQGEGKDDAKAELDRVLRDDPRSANAYRLYARYYLIDGHISGDSFRAGTLEAADQALGKALEIAPDYARAFVLQGHVYRLMGKPAQATAALQKADRLGTDDPWLHLNWAELLMDENRHEEAVARYRKVLADNDPRINTAAREGLIRYYKRTKRLDDAEGVYRADVAARPTSAWAHGNYASFLLCWRGDADAAIVEATKARELMDYGIARLTLAGALYRKWAVLALDGNKHADEPMMAAVKLIGQGPASTIDASCGGGVAVLPVLEAMLLTGEGERISAKVAGVLAAEEDGSVPGLFVMKVQASGRDRNYLYLNSETDYRDARNLSVVFAPEVEAAFTRKYGSAPDQFLKGKDITVLGYATQVKIHFIERGKPTDKYYYQTQLMLAKPDYLRVSE